MAEKQTLVDELGQTVAQVWADVLDLDQVWPGDGFFELGGHSLTALRVVYRLRDKLSVDLSLRDLMEARTLAEFTETVRTAQSGAPARPVVALVGRRGTR
ncbi:phosphopantetheine-binding protein [Amycolatopsis sp. H20-H5]|uniref:phosphopantetheine-binding protein n=1 Tax=Amycolatopsis sp. H20-H5 TaxID=3046309 RepID=UPI002DB7E839|nr:phosphopantetheine-binding protein [Amycolatopsis sp. H20-H5]MEC3978296.1 phosphopantetheine-binding protein [Amycolatopsis sp. H20-H5]